MLVSLIAAVAENGVIGRDGGLPWRLSADLRRFKALTMGHPIIMGRRTWESLGRPLPGRTSIVVTRQSEFATPFADVRIARDVPAAIQAASAAPGGDEVFIIGGGQIYAAAMPLANRLYLTRVLGDVAGDAYFPEYDRADWRLITSQRGAADAKNDHAHAFELYERVT